MSRGIWHFCKIWLFGLQFTGGQAHFLPYCQNPLLKNCLLFRETEASIFKNAKIAGYCGQKCAKCWKWNFEVKMLHFWLTPGFKKRIMQTMNKGVHQRLSAPSFGTVFDERLFSVYCGRLTLAEKIKWCDSFKWKCRVCRNSRIRFQQKTEKIAASLPYIRIKWTEREYFLHKA